MAGVLVALLLAASVADENTVRRLLRGEPGLVRLPAGRISVSAGIRIPDGFRVRGHEDGTVLAASGSFAGRAILLCGRNVTIEALTVDGNRALLARTEELAPYDRDFIGYYDLNGLIADQADNLT